MSAQLFKGKAAHWPGAFRWMAALGATAILAACGGGGGGGSAEAQGTLRMALTDAPACGYDNVFVTVEKVRVHQSATAGDEEGGWTDLTLSPARKIDLLNLTNGVLEELGSTTLTAGHYSQIRLVLAENTTDPMANSVKLTGGALTALKTPSGQQSGLKLKANFDVTAGQVADLVLDFDACKSIVKAGNSGQYLLKPVITVFPRVGSGIQGYVSTTTTVGTSTVALGTTTVAAQQNGTTVRSTIPDSNGWFNITLLPAGTYTLVVTSEGASTAVVTDIPVSATPTVINGTTTAIAMPASSMANVTGTVTVTSSTSSGTTTAALTDATARALQALTGGPTIELAKQFVDSVLGTYSFRLPVAAPRKAAYAASSLSSFTADTAVAGKYTIEVTSPTQAGTLLQPVDISGGGNATANFNYGP